MTPTSERFDVRLIRVSGEMHRNRSSTLRCPVESNLVLDHVTCWTTLQANLLWIYSSGTKPTLDLRSKNLGIAVHEDVDRRHIRISCIFVLH
jgi:hypothetical protein